MIKLVIFYAFYLAVIFSTLGYGFLALDCLKRKHADKHLNIGLVGLYGVFLLIVISYLTNLFFAHSLIHNTLIAIMGLILFVFFTFKRKIKLELKLFLFVFGILFIAFLVFKNHDDFFYYHFPYTFNLVNDKIQFGMGHFGHGFRTASSIFYLNSLFYLPIIDINLFNLGQLMIWGFADLILIKEIINKKNIHESNFLFFLRLLTFTFINIVFYRLGEHGTDRSAQILIFLLVIYILDFTNAKKFLKQELENIIVVSLIIISLKAFYILYLIFGVQLIFKFIHLKLKIKNFLKLKLLLGISLVLTILVSNANFSNSGCIIYPIKETCVNNLEWAIDKKEVQLMNNWYELWSKAGATPNSRVDNPDEYIKKFNWVLNWFDEYFFNKVSDTLLGTIFIIGVFIFLFYGKKISKEKKFSFLFTYALIFILFFEWFYNHPALRYGGFSLLALILFLPACKYLSSFDIKKRKKEIAVYSIIIITIFAFAFRNLNRIHNEYMGYNYNPFSDPYYKVIDNGYRVDVDLKKIHKEYNDCKLFNNCKEGPGMKVKKLHNYNFYIWQK